MVVAIDQIRTKQQTNYKGNDEAMLCWTVFFLILLASIAIEFLVVFWSDVVTVFSASS